MAYRTVSGFFFCRSLIFWALFSHGSSADDGDTSTITGFPRMNFDGDKKLRVGIMMVDDRELQLSLDSRTPYNSLVAILNYNYAQRHGYGFHVYHPRLNVEVTVRKYDVDSPEKQFNDSEPNLTSNQRRDKMGDPRHRASAFHPQLKQFRGATWSKLLGLYHAAATFSDRYDLMMYLDSDAALTSINGHKTIESMLRKWQSNNNITWGVKDLRETAMIFFPDTPFGDMAPCDGVIIFRPKISVPLIKSWWDYNISAKNFALYHEQDALRTILGEKQRQYALNMSTTSMVSERQFPKDMSVAEW
jgi:hypothetical protein